MGPQDAEGSFEGLTIKRLTWGSSLLQSPFQSLLWQPLSCTLWFAIGYRGVRPTRPHGMLSHILEF